MSRVSIKSIKNMMGIKKIMIISYVLLDINSKYYNAIIYLSLRLVLYGKALLAEYHSNGQYSIFSVYTFSSLGRNRFRARASKW